MEKEKIEGYYQNRAKEIIDCMFDGKIFRDNITRDDMNGFEDLLAFQFQCNARTAQSMADFTAKYKK